MVVFSIVAGCACAVILYQRFTNPLAVRQQVLAKLMTQFPGAVSTVDSARLRIFGGISVNGLRMARNDDPDKSELLHVPSAVFYQDKEKILEGTLALLKVELHRPHMRAHRDKDGNWNLKDIGGTFNPNLSIPTVVIYQGTLVLEDRNEKGTGKTLELTDVNLQIINDPLPTVTIEGSAQSAVAGKLRIGGQWDRNTHELTLTLNAQHILLSDIVVGSLEKLCPAGTLEGLKLDGKGDLQADIAYHPGVYQPLTYDVALHLTQTKLSHPKLPLPLENLDATLTCNNKCGVGELRIKKLQAKSGQTEIEAHGSGLLASLDKNGEWHLTARHLETRENLFINLPEKVRNLYGLFSPTGQVTFRADIARRDGSWSPLASGDPSGFQLTPENMGFTFAKFPYPLDRVTGNLDMNLITELVQLNVTGYTGPRPVFIKGTWQGRGLPKADCKIEITAADIPLDQKIVDALLVPEFNKLARSFHASGKGDIKAYIRHEPGAEDFHNEYHVWFHEAAIRWDTCPYPLENVSGYLDINPNKHWEFRGGRGTHRGCEVLVQGGSLNKQAKNAGPNPGVVIEILGHNVPVDEELHQSLEPIKQLANSWDTFRPRGQLNFHAKIEHRTSAPEDEDVQLEVQGATIQPVFFSYALDNIAGKFHFHENKLEIRNASAQHQGTRIALEYGKVDLHRGGGHFTDLTELTADALVIDDDLMGALPKELRNGAATLKLQGPVQLKTRLVVSVRAEPGSVPDIFWDGTALLKNAKFATGLGWDQVSGSLGAVGRCVGHRLIGLKGNILLEEATLLNQPFHDLQASFLIKENSPDVMVLDLKAPIYGGDISGEARIEFNSTPRYEINLTGSQLDLSQFGMHNQGSSSQLKGVAMARVHLTGTNHETLEGNGSVDVPNGRLYNLPLILDILKFLGLRSDRTSFEELHASFSIHGPRVSMHKLEILGNTFSLTGQGEFNLDGTNVALDFYPAWARLDQLLPPALRPLPPAVGKNLITIEMRGKITADEKDRKFTMKPIPGIIDPLMHWRNRLNGSASMDNREEPRLLPALGMSK